MEQFKYSYNNKRYHTVDYFYKQKFGGKVCKISLNAGFTCPNIDGTKGYGGCIYCSPMGSGDYAGKKDDNLIKQFEDIKNIMSKKWPNAKYIGYFQANSNTYADVETLKERYECILKLDNVIGLSIATRPDCINDECLNYLEKLNKKTFLTIELGLQTIHEKTSDYINRCHDLKCFEDMVYKLKKKNINVIIHIINGLPYETKEDMIETIKYINKLPIDGVKIHMLHILQNTVISKRYKEESFHILTKEEYIDIICNQLQNLREELVIHRITGDPKIDDLMEPKWLIKKFCLLNDIDKELKKRDIIQGEKVTFLY